MEDPRKKKKDVWSEIAKQLSKTMKANFSREKVEYKWRNLIKSHKDIKLNKSRTGQKRKSFQYFKEIEDILSKRHDINPPFLTGNNVPTIVTTPEHVNTETGSTGAANDRSSPVKTFSAKTPFSVHKKKKVSTKRDDELLTFLREMQEDSKRQFAEREQNKNERARKRNEIMREFLEHLKNW